MHPKEIAPLLNMQNQPPPTKYPSHAQPLSAAIKILHHHCLQPKNQNQLPPLSHIPPAKRQPPAILHLS